MGAEGGDLPDGEGCPAECVTLIEEIVAVCEVGDVLFPAMDDEDPQAEDTTYEGEVFMYALADGTFGCQLSEVEEAEAPEGCEGGWEASEQDWGAWVMFSCDTQEADDDSCTNACAEAIFDLNAACRSTQGWNDVNVELAMFLSNEYGDECGSNIAITQKVVKVEVPAKVELKGLDGFDDMEDEAKVATATVVQKGLQNAIQESGSNGVVVVDKIGDFVVDNDSRRLEGGLAVEFRIILAVSCEDDCDGDEGDSVATEAITTLTEVVESGAELAQAIVEAAEEEGSEATSFFATVTVDSDAFEPPTLEDVVEEVIEPTATMAPTPAPTVDTDDEEIDTDDSPAASVKTGALSLVVAVGVAMFTMA
jgi:hypothetical protein